MLNLKGCPKCQGALYLARDMYGKYVNCLQCGFTKDVPELAPGTASAEPAKPEFRQPERRAA